MVQIIIVPKIRIIIHYKSNSFKYFEVYTKIMRVLIFAYFK